MDFSFSSPTPQGDARAGSSQAGERLRKSIERNRAKQARRSGEQRAINPAPKSSIPVPPKATAFPKGEESVSMMEKLKKLKSQASSNVGKMSSSFSGSSSSNGSPFSSARSHSRTPSAPLAEDDIGVTRKTVATPQKFDFIDDGKSRSLSSTPPDYIPEALGVSKMTPVLRKKAKRKVVTKSKSAKSMLRDIFIFLCWIFCGLLVFRLIFADGGVIDYYSAFGVLENKMVEIETNKENIEDLKTEIEQIMGSKSYQKKLVRDHLGFIADDEYLVLFR